MVYMVKAYLGIHIKIWTFLNVYSILCFLYWIRRGSYMVMLLSRFGLNI